MPVKALSLCGSSFFLFLCVSFCFFSMFVYCVDGLCCYFIGLCSCFVLCGSCDVAFCLFLFCRLRVVGIAVHLCFFSIGRREVLLTVLSFLPVIVFVYR